MQYVNKTRRLAERVRSPADGGRLTRHKLPTTTKSDACIWNTPHIDVKSRATAAGPSRVVQARAARIGSSKWRN